MWNEEIKDWDLEGYPNEDEKVRGGMKDVIAGTSIISVVRKLMEKIKQMYDRIKQTELISEEHEKCQSIC